MDILDLISIVGIIVSVYIVVFTSQELVRIYPFVREEYWYIIAFVAMHLIFGLKYVLSVVIQDEPDWVVEDEENVTNRTAQVEEDNADKKLMQRLDPHFTSLDLLFEVLNMQHSN